MCIGRVCVDSDEESDDKIDDNSSNGSSTFDLDEEVHIAINSVLFAYLHFT